jgi:NAD(P)-dependent dehydrogenase (short-subunit alcohol dehydrogenase family)
MNSYKGKVAVITGAARGIGRAIAFRCAQEGMSLVLADYSDGRLQDAAKEFSHQGVKTLAVKTDVSIFKQMENLAQQSYDAFGQVDLLVNNAGVVAPASILNQSLQDWSWMFAVNFFGVLHGFKAFLPKMVEQDSQSRIVSTGSIAGVTTAGRAYDVSKHAVVALSEAYYLELAKQGISKVRVSVLCPGWVNTELENSERSRPAQFSKGSTTTSRETKKKFRALLESGFSPERTAEILFEGIAQDKLYIGPVAFENLMNGIQSAIKQRGINIAQEQNPV